MTSPVKNCYKCKAEKILDDFDNIKVKGEIKKHSYCKECRRKYNRKASNEYYKNNSDSRKKYGAEYRAKEDFPERRRNWKNSQFKRLSEGVVVALLATQLNTTVSEIRQIPGIIELKRNTLLLKRKIKDNGTE